MTSRYESWEASLDDVLACDTDREGEEDYDLGDQCKPCFNGQHQRCTKQSGTFAGRPCSCRAAGSIVFHPRQSGRLILKMENS
jgi:hypothetical protein